MNDADWNQAVHNYTTDSYTTFLRLSLPYALCFLNIYKELAIKHNRS